MITAITNTPRTWKWRTARGRSSSIASCSFSAPVLRVCLSYNKNVWNSQNMDVSTPAAMGKRVDELNEVKRCEAIHLIPGSVHWGNPSDMYGKHVSNACGDVQCGVQMDWNCTRWGVGGCGGKSRGIREMNTTDSPYRALRVIYRWG